jgi:hypothetical protein
MSQKALLYFSKYNNCIQLCDKTGWRYRRSFIPSPAARGLVTILTELSELLRMFNNGK